MKGGREEGEKWANSVRKFVEDAELAHDEEHKPPKYGHEEEHLRNKLHEDTVKLLEVAVVCVCVKGGRDLDILT